MWHDFTKKRHGKLLLFFILTSMFFFISCGKSITPLSEAERASLRLELFIKESTQLQGESRQKRQELREQLKQGLISQSDYQKQFVDETTRYKAKRSEIYNKYLEENKKRGFDYTRPETAVSSGQPTPFTKQGN